MFNLLFPSHLTFLVLLDIFKIHKSYYTLKSVREVCKQDIEMYKYLKNSLKNCKFCKFCYWQRLTLKLFNKLYFDKNSCTVFFWEKPDLKNSFWVHPRWNATFLNLHVHREQIYKKCTSSWTFAWIFQKISDQHLGQFFP